MSSIKISQVFLDGFLWYWSDVKSNRTGGPVMGASYYEDLFENYSSDCNLPYEDVFLSKFLLLDKTHYVEHNEILTDEEISIINALFDELTALWRKSEDEIQILLNASKNTIHKSGSMTILSLCLLLFNMICSSI